MNKPLLESIKNALTTASNCPHVYYLHLPSKELLRYFTVTYEVQNPENVGTYEDKESIKIYSLRVNLNAPELSNLENKSIYIKNGVYSLRSADPKVRSVVLANEQNFWDSELNIYTEYLNFEIQYS